MSTQLMPYGLPGIEYGTAPKEIVAEEPIGEAVWPFSLPQSAEMAYQEMRVPGGVLRVPMDAGPAKLRRRYTKERRHMTVRVILARAQVDTLRAFYRQTLASGSRTFDWVHPRTQVPASFQFVGEPNYAPIGQEHWMVEMPLELRT